MGPVGISSSNMLICPDVEARRFYLNIMTRLCDPKAPSSELGKIVQRCIKLDRGTPERAPAEYAPALNIHCWIRGLVLILWDDQG